MKKWCVVFIMSFLAIANSFGQNNKQFYFKIDGTINADTGTVTLNFLTDYIPNNVNDLVGKVKNGKFSISGYLPEPQSVEIRFDDDYLSSDFIIEKGLQTISINTDSTRKMPVVSNSTMVNEYPLYSAFFKQHSIKRNICDQKYNTLYKLNNYHLPEAIKFSQSKELEILYKEHDKLLLTYSGKNPNSEIAFWELIRLMGWGYEPIFDSIYNSFSYQLKNGYAGRVLNKKLEEGKLLSIGKQFPSLQCINRNNEKFSSALFTNRKLILVDFWYSRCGPCRAQFSTLKNLYTQFSTKGFEIVGISVDKITERKKWKETIVNDQLIWLQYWDIDGKDAHRLSINAFPTNFLIDHTGKIIAKNISLGELEEVLSRSLK
ncbi:MAG: TlpA disulfide reductase family protein [Bacteroidia bacterium]